MGLRLTCIVLTLVACAPRYARHHEWWHTYGMSHSCVVIGERETEWVGRRGHVHEREQTCYRCPGDAGPYCFEGPPL